MKFSVIIPAYNVKDYIRKCIESVLMQSFSDFEIIVINDGSTDETSNILKQISSKYNINIITKNNEGLGFARNDGIKYSKGDYLIFIDGDDWIDGDYLKKASEIIDLYEPDIIRFSWFRTENGVSAYQTDFLKDYNSDQIKELLILDRIGSQAWKNIYRRTLFDGIIYPQTLFEDIPTTFKLFYKANNIFYSEDAFYHYVIRKGSISFSKKPEISLDIYKGNLEKYNFISLNDKKLISQFFPILAKSAVQSNHYLSLDNNFSIIKTQSSFLLKEIKLKKIKVDCKIKCELKLSKNFTKLYSLICRKVLRQKNG